jgi:hypothetical protein
MNSENSKQTEELEKALEPFARIGQWLFARDLPDETPMVTVQGAGKDVHLTRGMFKAAHLAHRALTETRQALTQGVCDCERGHNGVGLAGRECDCQFPTAIDAAISRAQGKSS